jgi:hypothetical protein
VNGDNRKQQSGEPVRESPERPGQLEAGERNPLDPADQDQADEAIERKLAQIRREVTQPGLVDEPIQFGLDHVVPDHQPQRGNAQIPVDDVHPVEPAKQGFDDPGPRSEDQGQAHRGDRRRPERDADG